MSLPLSWPSPAKLNLFLHINNKRQDGYHELQTLFQLLDVGDTITITPLATPDIRLRNQLEGVEQNDNLVIKAAKLLQTHTHSTQGCEIDIDKRLPMGGGVGGGSSNAATTLVALNYLWKTGLSLTELAELGKSLGADVPIFVIGHTAFAEGVGEKITPTELPECYYLVVNPGVHVSTKAIFSHPDLPRQTNKIQWDNYTFNSTGNDCEKVVCELYPNIANTLQGLLECAPSRMTGTGACLFAIFDTKEHATRVKNSLPAGLDSFVAKGVNESPLHTLLNSL